ncbi:MAG: terminase small subunit [Chitinophagales bacterium]|nr:terminase small subunit [Chitinophagales bacterium]MBP9845849.1 terminase small subunit [Saprospiraceae bacterium]
MALNARQKKFCEQYLIDLNATQAALRAGYSKKTSYAIGFENLKKVEIQKYISERQNKLAESTGITQERVLAEYAKIAFSDVRSLFDENSRLLSIKDIPDAIAAALSSVEVDQIYNNIPAGKVEIGDTKKVKLWDKTKALDSIARHLGMFAKDNAQSKPEVIVPPVSDEKIDQVITALRNIKNDTQTP